MTIDLTRLNAVLDEVDTLIEELDGLDLDDRDSVPTEERKMARAQRVEAGQKLQLLAQHLDLGAALVRSEYWFSRGQKDPLDPERKL